MFDMSCYTNIYDPYLAYTPTLTGVGTVIITVTVVVTYIVIAIVIGADFPEFRGRLCWGGSILTQLPRPVV